MFSSMPAACSSRSRKPGRGSGRFKGVCLPNCSRPGQGRMGLFPVRYPLVVTARASPMRDLSRLAPMLLLDQRLRHRSGAPGCECGADDPHLEHPSRSQRRGRAQSGSQGQVHLQAGRRSGLPSGGRREVRALGRCRPDCRSGSDQRDGCRIRIVHALPGRPLRPGDSQLVAGPSDTFSQASRGR